MKLVQMLNFSYNKRTDIKKHSPHVLHCNKLINMKLFNFFDISQVDKTNIRSFNIQFVIVTSAEGEIVCSMLSYSSGEPVLHS